MNGIDAIQPNNIYRVNAVNLFENRNQSNARTNNIFNTGYLHSRLTIIII